jgi:hypothetical protein
MKVDLKIISAAALVVVLLLGALPINGVQAEPLEGTWDGGQALQMNTNNGFDPWVAQSSNGNKIAVWVEQDPEPGFSNQPNFIRFSMYTPLTGWSGPQTLAGTGEGITFSNPQVGMSDNGSAVVSWILYNPDYSMYYMYSRTYVPGIGWDGTYYHGQTDSHDSRAYRLSVNGDGDALLAHDQMDSSDHSVVVWTYQAGSGWDAAPEVLQTIPLADKFYFVKTVLSDSGLAATVWQTIDSDNRVMASTRNATGVWGAPDEIDTNGMWDFSTRVGVDDSTGEFMVTYRKNEAPYYNTYYSVTENGTWSAPLPVAGVNRSDCYNQNMVMNRDGIALVVTTEHVAAGWNVNATFYDDGEWTAPTTIAANLTGLYYPEVVIDDLGRAVVSFTIDDDRVVSIYTPEEGWTEPVPVEMNALGSTYSLGSISLESGSILVGYTSTLYYGTVWVSMFEASDTTPPALSVDQALTSETERPMFEITGTTEPGAVVDVNGKPVPVSASGEFSILVELSAGANSLVVTAADGAGNNATETLTVTYNDPLPELEEQIADQQDTIEQQQGTIDQLQEDLDAANDEIAGVGSTAMMFGIIGVVGLIVAIVALVMVFLRRKG